MRLYDAGHHYGILLLTPEFGQHIARRERSF